MNRLLSFLFLLLWASLPLFAQPACQPPGLKPTAPGVNIFSDAQEAQLGAILHRSIEQDTKFIEEERLVAELQKVGDSLSKSFPATGLKFRYSIFDIPEANALALPGGYVNISRKLIAQFKSEDELAAVMAHEMGHIVTHQGAIAMSKRLRDVLNVRELGDEDDVQAKYNDLLDNYQKKPGAFRTSRSDEDRQLEADEIGVYALARSGYNVQAMATFWDRFTENKGKKGNAFTDFFGATTEEQRRFRDMLKNASSVAPGCVPTPIKQDATAFKKWQDDVLTYRGIGHPEHLDGLLNRQPLNPPLRSEMVTIRVSPDGKYVLGEEQGSIVVLTRSDLKQLFRIPVVETRSVQFSMDSKLLTFYSLKSFSSPRVEIWDLEEQTLRSAHEIHLQKGCSQAALSPEGRYFACISMGQDNGLGIDFDLRLVNVETGETIGEKKNLCSVTYSSTLSSLIESVIHDDETRIGALHFSPDSKYLLFGRYDETYAMDTSTGGKWSIPGNIKDVITRNFSVLGADRIVGVAGDKGAKGAVVRFPSGEVLYSNLAMGLAQVRGASKGDYVIVSPVKDHAAAIFDVKANRFIVGIKKGSVDVYGEEYIHEQLNGEISATDISTQKIIRSAEMKAGPIGQLTAVGSSDDLNFVALSGRVRGAIWDVKRNKRILHLRRFNGVSVDTTGLVLADFPQQGETKRQFAQIQSETEANSFEAEADTRYHEAGGYLFEWKAAKKNAWDKDVTCRMLSMKDRSVQWQRRFPDGLPRVITAPETNSLIFDYDLATDAGKKGVEQNPALKEKVKKLPNKEQVLALEVVDLGSGRELATLAVETGKGSFSLRDGFIAANRIVVIDSLDRLRVYDLEGHLKARVQAKQATATIDGRYLAADIGRGKVVIYDLQNMKAVNELDFSSEVAYANFSKSGDRLLVVTREQDAYFFDTAKLNDKSTVASTQ